MGQIGRQKTASRPERARGDGQDGGRALATGILPHEWPSGKCRARPPSKRHRWRALLFRHVRGVQVEAEWGEEERTEVWIYGQPRAGGG
jgi:hypothetical protein